MAVDTGLMTFDEWRARYDEMTDDEHISFAYACMRKWPDQNRVNLQAVNRFFEEVAVRPRNVAEVGGFNGTAAAHVLERFPGIRSWENIELAVADDHKPPRGRYQVVPCFRFRWWEGRNRDRLHDTLVCSHVLEHLKLHDVDGLLDYYRGARNVYVECPVGDEPRSWDGYHGTHILEVGWRGLHDLFAEHGFVPVKLTDEAYAYRRDYHVDPWT